MFKVDAESRRAHFAFDPARKPELLKLDAAIRRAAPNLTGISIAARRRSARYALQDDRLRPMELYREQRPCTWPALGVALQKNYISVYVSVRKNGRPIVPRQAGRLGALRTAEHQFSFLHVDDVYVVRTYRPGST